MSLFGWGGKKEVVPSQESKKIVLGDSVRVSATKFDTAHSCGSGSFGITGKYASKTDSFGIDGVVRMNENVALHAAYGVTEEKIVGLGIEGGFAAFDRENVVDLEYSPATKAAQLNVGVRQGKSRITAQYAFPNITTDRKQFPASSYELSTKLNDLESLKMSYDVTSKASKVKLSRKLDGRNRFEAEYNYDARANKFMVLSLKHSLNNTHSFNFGANYGSKKFKAEWGIDTGSGPWTLTSSFGFNTAPIKGDFSIKRRFEM